MLFTYRTLYFEESLEMNVDSKDHVVSISMFAPRIFLYITHIQKIDQQSLLKQVFQISSLNPERNQQFYQECKKKGNSNSFFMFTSDKRYIMKTISSNEANLLLEILPQYQKHLEKETLLCIILGIFKIKIKGQDPVYILLMQNKAENDDYFAKFDLKGSDRRMVLKPEEVSEIPKAQGDQQSNQDLVKIYKFPSPLKPIYLDLDFQEYKKHIEMSEEQRAKFLELIFNDIDLLARNQIFDYSLLIFCYKEEPYYKFGIIDFTQFFGLRRRCEILLKKCMCKKNFSVKPAKDYALRFKDTMERIVKVKENSA